MVTMILTVIFVLRIISKTLLKGQEDLEIRGQVKTIHTTALGATKILKSPVDLRRLAFTQTPAKTHLLTLVRKSPEEEEFAEILRSKRTIKSRPEDPPLC